MNQFHIENVWNVIEFENIAEVHLRCDQIMHFLYKQEIFWYEFICYSFNRFLEIDCLVYNCMKFKHGLEQLLLIQALYCSYIYLQDLMSLMI